MRLLHPLRLRQLRQLALVLAAAAAGGPATCLAAERPVVRVWPGTPPGDEQFQPPAATSTAPKRDDKIVRLALVTEPTLTVYRAPGAAAPRPTVLVCPGGGYNILAWDLEGTEVAEWLNSIGVSAVVLKYRVPRRSRDQPHVAPLQDAQRALRLVRHHAAEWGVDPQRLGILGFSAGGHLAVMAGTQWPEPAYAALDAIDRLDCRPDFLIPIYPAYLADENKPGPLEPLVKVTAKTPPTFVAVTSDDKLRGANAALFYAELRRAGVAAELHVFLQGGHGYGLRPSANPVSQWPKLCEAWLRAQGLLEPATAPR